MPVTTYIEVQQLEPGTLYRFNVYTLHNGEESLPLTGEQATSEYKGCLVSLWTCNLLQTKCSAS